MKKTLVFLLVLVLAVVFTLSFASCQSEEEAAIKDAEAFANQYLTDNPNEYVTPNFVASHLMDVLGYSEDIATHAVENCSIDWQESANKYAQVYLTYVAEFDFPAGWWTASDIQDMLYNDGFFADTVDTVMANIDWMAQSKEYVLHLSDFYYTFNRLDAVAHLENVAANEETLSYLLENSNVDWEMHALNMANQLWREYSMDEYYADMSAAELLSDIKVELTSLWQFTESEAQYAISNVTTD